MNISNWIRTQTNFSQVLYQGEIFEFFALDFVVGEVEFLELLEGREVLEGTEVAADEGESFGEFEFLELGAELGRDFGDFELVELDYLLFVVFLGGDPIVNR